MGDAISRVREELAWPSNDKGRRSVRRKLSGIGSEFYEQQRVQAAQEMERLTGEQEQVRTWRWNSCVETGCNLRWRSSAGGRL